MKFAFNPRLFSQRNLVTPFPLRVSAKSILPSGGITLLLHSPLLDLMHFLAF